MQLKSLRLGAMGLAGAVLLAVALTAFWPGATAVAQQAGTDGLSVSVDWADTGPGGLPSVRFSVTNASGQAKDYVGVSCAFLLNGHAQTTVDWFVGDIGAGDTVYETAWSEEKSARFNSVRCRVSGGRNAEDAAIASERDTEHVRIQRSVLDVVRYFGKERERAVRGLRSKAEFSALQESVDSQIAWIEEIESGDPRIMFETALRLRDGDGLPQHRRTARIWLERAGDHGVPEAYHAAARMLFDEPDFFLNWKGRSLLKLAARYGVAAAQKEVATRELARVGEIEGYNNRPYAWLLLAQANGADVTDAEFAAASHNLSKDRRKDARAIAQRALGKVRLPRFWPLVRADDPAEIFKEDLHAALRWHECGRALSIIDDARRAGIAAAKSELGFLNDEGTCID